jgi:signal transduction histidine kinase
VDLCSLLNETLTGLQEIYGNRFKLQCKPGVHGHWDPMVLRRAIENLCTNAVKYGDEDTVIEVFAEETADHRNVSIQVRNQGQPLSPKDQKKVFDIFMRGEVAEVSGQTGWGLGLNLVRGAAEVHGGHVEVNRFEDRTVFTIELPTEASPKEAPPPSL